MVDHLHRDPPVLRPIERPRHLAIQRLPRRLVDLCAQGGFQAFVGVVGAEEIGVADEEAFFVVVGVEHPERDAVGVLGNDLAGLRLEHTTVDADFTSVNTTVNQNYNNLIPSISIQRTFKSSSFNFGFTQRIQRPSIYQLNPFVNNSNPLFISTGNPALRPELNNNFELTYSHFATNSFNAGLSYQFSNNSIQNVTNLKVDSTANNMKDTVNSTTYENLGSNRSLGLNINTNLNITKQLTLSLNGQVAEVWLTGTYNGQFYKNSGLTGNAFANAGYTFNGGYRIGINAGFFSGQVNLQGSSNDFIYNSLVLTRTFLNKKATFSLVANCPESKYHEYRSTTTTPQFYESSFNQNPYRTFAIRFSYKIGKLNSEIKKNQHGINNDDTKGGGQSGGNSGG